MLDGRCVGPRRPQPVRRPQHADPARAPRSSAASTLDAPAGVVDITPTALALLNVTPADASFDGRVLREAFAVRGAADEDAKAPRLDAKRSRAKAGAYEATVRVSGVGDRWYVDQASRVRR